MTVRPISGWWATLWLVIAIGALELVQLHLELSQLYFGIDWVYPNLNLAWVCPNYVWDLLGAPPTQSGAFFGTMIGPIGES